MLKEKTWEVVSPTKFDKKSKVEDITTILLKNRNLITKKQIQDFLYPNLTIVTSNHVGIDQKQLHKALDRIQKAIETKEQMVIYGDYDVDGISASAILWETLNSLGGAVIPYIPHRVEEGYGLSEKGIENLKEQIPNVKLIITVDNGIVANKAVDFANKQGLDVIITDHHTSPAGEGQNLPKAYAIVHTTKLCGAGVAYILSLEIGKINAVNSEKIPSDHLGLVALATVADLVPLTEYNRTLLSVGLKVLREIKRPGLLALFQEAGIQQSEIDPYIIGHMIAPRLNAMGRIESAMDALRLLCTRDRLRAKVLADTLGRTNKQRQDLTFAATEHALALVGKKHIDAKTKKKLLFIAHEEYEEGIIGLVAGKLVEEYYLPAIVLSKGEKLSKASARSISGFNIIEFIRSASDLLVNAGGHPMAAGFTIETEKIEKLQEVLEDLAEKSLHDGLLIKTLKIDTELPLQLVTDKLYQAIEQLAPFGMGNPEPTFLSRVVVKDIRTVGKENKHLKLRVSSNSSFQYDAIGFGLGQWSKKIKVGDTIDIVYTIDENVWNGRKNIQLKVKDIKIINSNELYQ